MSDYDNAQKELQEAADDGNTEAVLLQGMVYMEQKDTASARKKFEEYVSQAEDSAEALMVWLSVILRMEIMTVLFPIFPVPSPLQKERN